MIPLLGPDDPLPSPTRALRVPNGLLAAGGGLGIPRLLEAYRLGIFPWFDEGDPVLWWSPDPRLVLRTDAMRISRTLRRRLRDASWHVTADTAFDAVVAACAAPRADSPGTWIVPAMQAAYGALHAEGHAHAIEVWDGASLVGGLYGVAIGRMFFGESMFSARPDGSKVALAVLTTQLSRWGWPLVDCQVASAHLVRLGAVPVPRRQFLADIAALVADDGRPGPWTLDADLPAAAAHAVSDRPLE